jgi:hypothetical protein
MKKIKIGLITLMLLSSFSSYAVKIKNGESSSAKVDVSNNLPEECTRSGSASDELEIKCAKLRQDLIQFYRETPDAVLVEKNKALKVKASSCEEVTDSFVICHGNRYILEINTVNNTYQKVKKVTDETEKMHIDKVKAK